MIVHTPTPAIPVTTTPINAVCPKCGLSMRSAKMSCCGRGGSWFGNCGSAVNANFGHTWYEGIRACEARLLSAAVVQQLHAFQLKSNVSSDAIMGVDASVILAALHMFGPTRATTSTLLSRATIAVTATGNSSIDMSSHTPSSASIAAHEQDMWLYFITYIAMIVTRLVYFVK